MGELGGDSGEGGRRLYSTLREVHCPDLQRITSDSLDWLYEEAELVPFLDWLTSALSSETFLTTEELEAFLQIPQSDVVSGGLLESALVAAGLSSECNSHQLTDTELEQAVAQLEAEVSLQEDSLDTILRLKARYVEQSSRECIYLGQMNSLKEPSLQEAKRRQEHILQLNNSLNGCLESLSGAVERVVGEFSSPASRDQTDHEEGKSVERVLFSEIDLEAIETAERELGLQIGSLVRSQFGAQFATLGLLDKDDEKPGHHEEPLSASTRLPHILDLEEDSCLDLVRGRDRAEFEQMIAEINRLRISYFHSEVQRLNTLAKDAGVVSCISLLESKGGSVRPVQDQVVQPESRARPVILITQDESKLQEELSCLVAECSNYYCQQILLTDYQMKTARSGYVLEKLTQFRNLLLGRKARHEILDLLLSHESNEMLNIQQTLKNLSDSLIETNRKEQNFVAAVKSLLGNKISDTSNLIQPADFTLVNAHKILRSSGLVGPLATYPSVTEAVSSLLEEKRSLETSLANLNTSKLDQLKKMECSLRKLYKLLNISPPGASLQPVRLVPREISHGIAKLEAGIKDLEQGLKQAMTEWEKESKSDLKSRPHLKLQRELWVDFLLRPEILSANVKALESKIKE